VTGTDGLEIAIRFTDPAQNGQPFVAVARERRIMWVSHIARTG
jgi:hypothetical protein